MILGRKRAIDSRDLFDRLVSGQRLREIDRELGLKNRAMEMRVRRYMKPNGLRTTEQAVAHYVATKIKRSLPLALQSQVDLVMRKK
jgi:hypothetical protein